MIQNLEILFNEKTFTEYLSTVASHYSYYPTKLNVDLTELLDILNDPVLQKMQKFGYKDSLIRTLVTVQEECAVKSCTHPDWAILAGRIENFRLQLLITNFTDTFSSQFNPEFAQFCLDHSEELEAMINPDLNYNFTICGTKTLEKSYLAKHNGSFIEDPQRMYLRVATFLFMPNLDVIKEYYDLFSQGYYTHASPTLFNSGMKKCNLASCFLLSMQDSLTEIFKCLSNCAIISKNMGGIGLDISNIRHSEIGEDTGKSSGIVPLLKVYDATMRYVDQSGRRKGSATIFLQPWHIDILDFVELKRQHGSEVHRARDLFYSIWNCDLFMERVRDDETWSLFCPNKARMLTETYGEEFEKEYLRLENEQKYMKQLPARQIWNEILTTQVETGMPFMTNKDTANYTSNQKNLGLIRSSNLCQEICEVTDSTTISSCNLASIILDSYVKNGEYNFNLLGSVTRKIVRALNNVIDRCTYPLSETETGPIESTNLRYRPLGIGVQALAETFFKLDLAWTDAEAREMNKKIFRCIYYHALDESCEMAKEYGTYTGFEGSPASKGLLKPHLIAQNQTRLNLRGKNYTQEEFDEMYENILTDKLVDWDWDTLIEKIKKHGLRNSLLVALMPTASTANIHNRTESFEPVSRNIYLKSVLSGSYIICNKFMVEKLNEIGLWNKSISNFIIKNEGSVQDIPEKLVEKDSIKLEKLRRIKEMFKTGFELKQKLIVDFSIDRSYYVCQSQSLNIYIKDPTFQQLTGLHMYAWQNSLTTGMYYLRTEPATEAVKITEDGELDLEKSVLCTEDVCVMCSS